MLSSVSTQAHAPSAWHRTLAVRLATTTAKRRATQQSVPPEGDRLGYSYSGIPPFNRDLVHKHDTDKGEQAANRDAQPGTTHAD